MSNLFSDGFEGGNLNAWSSAVTDGGDLSVATAAKLHGVYGLSCLINDTTDMYVTDSTPTTEKIYRARFYVDPNSVAMTNNDAVLFLHGFSGAGSTIMYVNLKYTTALGYIILAAARDDASGTVYVTSGSITDAPHCVEVYWKAATSVGANNGYIELIIDGISIGNLANIDNDTRTIDYIEFGCKYKPAGTSGTIYLDDFASNNDGTLIGTISNSFQYYYKNKKWNHCYR